MSDKSKPEAAKTRAKVVIERTYRATLEEVWNLWTTKEGFESWWGPQGFRVEVHTMEARLGGGLHYDMIADTPDMVQAMKAMDRPGSHETRGKFTELQPQTRLALTHQIDFLPGVTPYEATILVELFPSGSDVRMKVSLDPMHSEEFGEMQKQGFTSQLTKLDQRFGGQARG